jgi:hypothetical protein
MNLKTTLHLTFMNNRIIGIDFAKQMPKPLEEVDMAKGFMKWGKKNDYPFFLNELLEGSPTHGGIIKNKIRYIAGMGVETIQGDLTEFLENKFSDFDMNEVSDMLVQDFEIYNAMVVKGTWDVAGEKVVKWEHIDYDNCRFSEDEMTVYISDDWNASKQSAQDTNYREISVYNPSKRVGSFFIYIKENVKKLKKEKGVYAKPSYSSGLLAINTEYNINKYNNALLENGFTTGTLVVFNDGKPETKEEAERIKDKLQGDTGAENAGAVRVTFSDGKDKGVEVHNLNGNDLDKRYDLTNRTCVENIVKAHQVFYSPLFGLRPEGSFNAAESADLFNIFNLTYIQPRQARINWLLNLMVELSGYVGKVQINGVNPFEAEKQTTEDGSVIEQDDVSKTALNGAQIASLVDVTARIKLGELTPESAFNIILASFPSIDVARARKIVGLESQPAQMCSHFKDESWKVFEKYGEPRSNFEEIETFDLDFERVGEIAVKLTDFERSLLQLLKDGEDSTAIANTTKKTILDVAKGIQSLRESGLINKNGEVSKLGDRLLNEELPELNYELRYIYVERPNVPAVKTQSREFCVKLLEMNKSYSREDINAMENEFGTNVFQYRGGDYTNPITKETTPYCRHIWKQQIVTRKK